jgi:exodeoxyribonuclease X
MNVILADTETTGTDPLKDQIIEAAWLNLPDTVSAFTAIRKTDAFTFYHERFKPSIPIGLGAMATHNIIHSDLDGCTDSEWFKLPDGVDYMIGHNIDFDAGMMKNTEVKRICTLALSRWLFPELETHKQVAMIYYIGQLHGREEWARELVSNAHAALDDVRVCAVLLRFLIGAIEAAGHTVDTWEQLHDISETARIPTIMGFGKHKGTPINEVPADYIQWYLRQAETDPYYVVAFRRARA